MKKFTPSVLRPALFVLITIAFALLQSCSSNKATVSCPALYKHSHHAYAFNWQPNHHNKHAASASTAKTTQENNVTAKVEQPVAETVPSMGIASLSNEVPDLKNTKELYKLFTAEERIEVKEQISSALAKNPVLKKLVNKRLDKMNSRYTAPAQSSFTAPGGGLSKGEILSIVALALCTFVPIASIVLGVLALKAIKEDDSRTFAKVFAIVAIAVNAAMILAVIIGVAVTVAALSAF